MGPRRRNESAKAWRERTKKSPRAIAAALRRASVVFGYEITVEQRDALFDEQGHRCAVCKRPFLVPLWHQICTFAGKVTGRRIQKSPAVDHDHETGQVRGLLCLWCNRTIVPLFDKHLEVMANAYLYIRDR